MRYDTRRADEGVVAEGYAGMRGYPLSIWNQNSEGKWRKQGSVATDSCLWGVIDSEQYSSFDGEVFVITTV